MDSSKNDWLLFALTGDPMQYLNYKKRQQQEETDTPNGQVFNM